MDLTKYDTVITQTKKPVYEKRYKNNGEQYLKKVDEIDIEEDLAEKKLEITRMKEILNTQERLKSQELIDNLTDEEYLKELQDLESVNEIDTYEFLNKINEIKHFYNLMPQDIRIKYKDLARFSKEFIPKLIEIQTEKLQATQQQTTQQQATQQIELEKKLAELQAKLEKGENTNV